MEITNGEITVELPDSLAKLLLDSERWKKGRARRAAGKPPRPAVQGDDPIPMTHIPGVVPGVSMNRVKKMVTNREVDVYVEGRVKKIKPSEVKAVLAAES